MQGRLLIPLLLLCLLLVSLLSLLLGSVQLPPAEILSALLFRGDALVSEILWDYRLPRTLFAIVIGAMLAVAGAMMQTLLRNPLADPYILGTSGGAAAGVLAAFYLALPGWFHLVAAVGGALFSTILLLLFSGFIGSRDTNRLLLTGIVLTTGWGALITFLLTLSPSSSLPGMLFWLVGDLNEQASLFVPALDMLLLGRQQAASLGVDVARMHLLLLGFAILLTATAVAFAGPIGFVGLVAPHIIRLMSGSGHRLLIPATALLGGILLVAADLLSRTLVAPRMMPAGVFMTLLGVPLFLYLIRRQS